MKKLIAILAFGLVMIPALAQNHTGYKLPEEPNRAKYIDFPSQDQGLWFAAQFTPAIGFGGARGIWAAADLIAGYRTGEFFRFGLGISPRFDQISGFGLPVYVDLRGNIISQESRMAVPYWNVDLGWAFNNNGVYFSPTVGARIGMPRNDFIVGLTYILQHSIYAGRVFSAVGLRVGYEF